ncbi:hypothetical protein ACFWXA_22655 [Streptomyces atroolivaceus]|uniref:hypothetical protein n=1 Tax=Streptomyces atroolivaceus TaxID=66869 RepID=UPI003667BCE4
MRPPDHPPAPHIDGPDHGRRVGEHVVVVDPADWATAPIFGDGAGAVVLRAARADAPGILGPVAWGSAGEQADAIHIPNGGSRRPSSTSTA